MFHLRSICASGTIRAQLQIPRFPPKKLHSPPRVRAAVCRERDASVDQVCLYVLQIPKNLARPVLSATSKYREDILFFRLFCSLFFCISELMQCQNRRRTRTSCKAAKLQSCRCCDVSPCVAIRHLFLIFFYFDQL